MLLQAMGRAGAATRNFEALWWVFAAVALGLLAVGGGYIWVSILVKRRSRGGAVAGRVIAISNATVIAAILGLATFTALRSTERVDGVSFVLGVLLYGTGMALNMVVAYLLGKVVKEHAVAG